MLLRGVDNASSVSMIGHGAVQWLALLAAGQTRTHPDALPLFLYEYFMRRLALRIN